MEGIKKIAISQMRSSVDVTRNMETIRNHVQTSKENGAVMAFFPENFNYLGKLGTSVNFGQYLDGEYMNYYQNLAREFEI